MNTFNKIRFGTDIVFVLGKGYDRAHVALLHGESYRSFMFRCIYDEVNVKQLDPISLLNMLLENKDTFTPVKDKDEDIQS